MVFEYVHEQSNILLYNAVPSMQALSVIPRWHVQDSTAAPQPLQPRTTAAAQPNIIGQVGAQAADQAAVMDVVAAYCAAQGNGAGVGEGHPMISKLAEALSAMPPQQLQDRLPPQ